MLRTGRPVFQQQQDQIGSHGRIGEVAVPETAGVCAPSLSILTVAGVGRLALDCRRESGVVAGRTFISRSVFIGTGPLRSPRLEH